MNFQNIDYVPALRYRRLTRFYDAVLAVTMREATFKSALLNQTELVPHQSILDLGCGTATLTLSLKKQNPMLKIIGLDGDRQALSIAWTKAQRANVDIHFDEGFSFNLPYSDESFNHVFSSLLFHHLTYENKKRTLEETYRVLKPSGVLHVADWGKPRSAVMRGLFLLVQLLDGFKTTSDNVQGRIPNLFGQAGFKPVTETHYFNTLFGTLRLYQTTKPE
ncbi:MAG: hypothetical protein BroJett018_21700 [Chloroflexota bacterium]|nr:class I SAM-dependent methyltransferase [Chloroflexota bacterium]NOG65460.1 class I SAM-dependent methyltransferase [Chloroflexota bacterium]GIK64376.1 MAG: hypothetical protein BroJett018_21700 [Chloroflexota bacterium]